MDKTVYYDHDYFEACGSTDVNMCSRADFPISPGEFCTGIAIGAYGKMLIPPEMGPAAVRSSLEGIDANTDGSWNQADFDDQYRIKNDPYISPEGRETVLSMDDPRYPQHYRYPELVTQLAQLQGNSLQDYSVMSKVAGAITNIYNHHDMVTPKTYGSGTAMWKLGECPNR